MTKKPFLFLNRGEIWPDEIKIGRTIIDKFDEERIIIGIKNIPGYDPAKYIETIKPIRGPNTGVRRIYVQKENGEISDMYHQELYDTLKDYLYLTNNSIN